VKKAARYRQTARIGLGLREATRMLSLPLTSPSKPALTIEMVSFRRAPSSATVVTGISKLS
jgi:hypothetical protein